MLYLVGKARHKKTTAFMSMRAGRSLPTVVLAFPSPTCPARPSPLANQLVHELKTHTVSIYEFKNRENKNILKIEF